MHHVGTRHRAHGSLMICRQNPVLDSGTKHSSTVVRRCLTRLLMLNHTKKSTSCLSLSCRLTHTGRDHASGELSCGQQSTKYAPGKSRKYEGCEARYIHDIFEPVGGRGVSYQ